MMTNLHKLLDYVTSQSGQPYSGRSYGSYQSLEVYGEQAQGQRNCRQRLEHIPVDFVGLRVLDLGCNSGGMLHILADRIEHGVGVDVNPNLINLANWVSKQNQHRNLDFYTTDLTKDPLDLLTAWANEESFDVVFMLSICMWLSNWHQIMKQVSQISTVLVLETNGSSDQQSQQVNEARKRFDTVIQLAQQSTDDPGQKNRQLWLAHSPLRTGRVEKGMGNSCRWMPQYFPDLFPGTLNIRLDSLRPAIGWKRTIDTHYGKPAQLTPAKLNGFPVQILRPPLADIENNPFTVEVAAEVNLRETLGLEDGDRIELTIPTGVSVKNA